MKKSEDYILKKQEDTIINGYTDFKNSGMNPLGINRVEYTNPKTGKKQAQSYFEMQDLVVPVIIKKDKKNGELHFAMQYEEVPSSIHGVQINLPDCPFFNKKQDIYSNGDVTECLEDRLSRLGLKMIGFKYLDSGVTAINQSITDQLMKIVYVYVEEKENNNDNNLQWYPVSCLKDFIEPKLSEDKYNEYTSVKTKYALQLFYNEFKEVIDKKTQTKFEYREGLLKNGASWKPVKTIMEHKYRFGETLVENKQRGQEVASFGSVAEMGTSRNSVECILVKKEGGKIKVGLSKQQRSPFIAREGVSEFFYEDVGGMVEPGEVVENAVKREVREETGYEINEENFYKICDFIQLSEATQESIAFYIAELDGTEKYLGLELDLDESIDDIEWFDLHEIDLNTFHCALPTKYMVLLARELYEKEKEIKAQNNDDVSR